MAAQRVAVAQLLSTSDKLRNLSDVAKCAGWAKRGGASMLFLPECFGFIGSSAKETLEAAELPLDKDSERNPDIVNRILSSAFESSFDGQACQPIQYPAEPMKVSLLDGLRTISLKSGLWISAGGMHVSGAPPSLEQPSRSRVYNTHVILDDQGDIQCSYRKIHLFDVSIPGKVSLQESATTAPGHELVTCDSPIGKFTAAKCMCDQKG